MVDHIVFFVQLFFQIVRICKSNKHEDKTSPSISLSLSLTLSGVVSVSFEEDEEGSLCLIAYPLHSESGDLENKDPSTDCEPKSKMVKWSNKKQSPLGPENDNYSKDRGRHSRKEDKIMR